MKIKLLAVMLLTALLASTVNLPAANAFYTREIEDDLSTEQEDMYRAVVDTISEIGGEEWQVYYDCRPSGPFNITASIYTTLPDADTASMVPEQYDIWSQVYCEQQDDPLETLEKAYSAIEPYLDYADKERPTYAKNLQWTSVEGKTALSWDTVSVYFDGYEGARERREFPAESYVGFAYGDFYCYARCQNFKYDPMSIARMLCRNFDKISDNTNDSNKPPTASFQTFPSDPGPDEPIVFVSTSTDPDDDELSYRWTLDGSPAGSFPSLEAGILGPGTHTITLFVSDGRGGEDEISRTITIYGPASIKLSVTPAQATLKNEETTPFTITVTIKDGTGKSVDGAYVYLTCEDPDLLTTRWWGKWVDKRYTENGVVQFSATLPDLLDVSTMVQFPSYINFKVRAGKIGEDWELTAGKTMIVQAEPRIFDIVLFDYYPEPNIKSAVFSDSDYYLRVKIRDEGDSIYWRYYITTPTGILSAPTATVSDDGKRLLVDSPFEEEQAQWHTPERGIDLDDLEFAKQLYQVDIAYIRNLSATAAGTIPVYGRFIKGVNDAYNVYDGVKTTWGFTRQAWNNLKRLEILAAIMDTGNAGIEMVQTTAGAVLLVPKALAPPGAKEAVNALTDTINAGIDHVQVGVQQLSQWSAPPEEYMRLERLQAKVKNQENRIVSREKIVQFIWWDWK